MISPVIFKTGDRTYRVEQKQWGQTLFDEDTAYLLSRYNPYVYPYRYEVDDEKQAYQPGLYKINNKVFIIMPKTDEDKKIYSKDRLITLTPTSIFDDLSDNIYEPPIEVTTDGDIFKPAIKQTDDIALAGMKYAIGKKNINFNSYANRFPDMATKNNGRRALTHGNTLKMDMLSRFADVFDINAALMFWDKKDCINPMDESHKKVFIIYNDDKIDLKDSDVTIEEIERD